MAVKRILIHFLVHPGLLVDLDEFRHEGRFGSRSEAVRYLIEAALSQKLARPAVVALPSNGRDEG